MQFRLIQLELHTNMHTDPATTNAVFWRLTFCHVERCR
ncbi:Uncharacterised protein [Vibrio cholerae]|nr:Uncharacterised protein [Vibrio cholerae]